LRDDIAGKAADAREENSHNKGDVESEGQPRFSQRPLLASGRAEKLEVCFMFLAQRGPPGNALRNGSSWSHNLPKQREAIIARDATIPIGKRCALTPRLSRPRRGCVPAAA
jgi:hypothetical protein